MTRVPFADQLTADQMAAALTVAARASGSQLQQAAVHLLTFTELPGRTDFAAHVDLDFVEIQGDESDGSPDESLLLARVRDWAVLLLDRRMYLTGGGRRLLELAGSLATGRPVDLSSQLTDLGHAHGRRVVEAVIIASGLSGFYHLTEGLKFIQMRQFQQELTGDDGQAGRRPLAPLPIRFAYWHTACGRVTAMSWDLARAFARDPRFQDTLYCAHCQAHAPIGRDGQFHWCDPDRPDRQSPTMDPKVGA